MADVSREDSSRDTLSKELTEHFTCAVCLDLLYKPVVGACGHMFCFWCGFNGMSGVAESNCPLCRRSFIYFPKVCKMLHSMLMKAAPEEYSRRGQEILCHEEEDCVFSPEIKAEAPLAPQHSKIDNESTMAGVDYLCSDLENIITNSADCQVKSQSGPSEEGSSQWEPVAKTDLSCALCHNVLYHPVVLNCGDVFCKSCLTLQNSKVCCPTCGTEHPAGPVLVCLELDQFSKSIFPTDYKDRSLQHLEEIAQPLNAATSGEILDLQNGTNFHLGIGCDGCGMYPIVGDRFRCQDCEDVAGFDLCGSCHHNNRSLIGRFNQKHRSTHRMSKIQRGIGPYVIL